jgi:hypothetical protein
MIFFNVDVVSMCVCACVCVDTTTQHIFEQMWQLHVQESIGYNVCKINYSNI